MDKSWMGKSRLSKEYDLGVEIFIKFGEHHANGPTLIRCPCLKCENREQYSSEDIRGHLYMYGIDQSYKTWFWHGESVDTKNKYGDMDKSWMERSRLSDEYDLGVEMFIKFGEHHAKGSTSMKCPCMRCKNRKCHSSNDIRDHLFIHGIDQSYTTWFWHGEKLSNELKDKEVGGNMDKSLDEENKYYDMDKSWMERSRLSKEYDLGVEMFIKFGERHAKGSTSMKCPCMRCKNRKCRSSNDIRDHLFIHGIDQGYTTWFWHGEKLSNELKDKEVGDNMDKSLDEENKDGDMDKSWMEKSRLSKEFDLGVEMFIKFAECHAKGSTSIRCPCRKCVNFKFRSSGEIRGHLYFHGIDQRYKTWIWHGEKLSNERKVKEVGNNMDKSLDEENKDGDMDKSWMGKSRLSKEYDLGVERFIKFGEGHAKGSTSIRCPCMKCENFKCHSSRDIRNHLHIHGIDQRYTTWFWHGEKLSNELKIEEVGDKMDESLDEENKDDDLEDTMETVKATHARIPLTSDCYQNIYNTSHIKFDGNKRKTRGPTTMREITRCSSLGERKVVKYNEDGQPIGVNAAKLKSFIGSCVHYHVPITYATWKHVPNAIKEKIFKLIQAGFVIDGRTKKSILQVAGTSFRQFKSRLTTNYIIPFKDQPHRLGNPPDIYSHIESHHWCQFVKSRLSKEFENMRALQVQRRAQNKYNHRLSRKGYANLYEELKKSYSIEKATQMNKKIVRENNTDTEEDEPLKDVDTKPEVTMNPSCDYVSTSGGSEYSDRPKGGGLSKPSAGLDITKSVSELIMQNKELKEKVKMINRRLEELEEKVRLGRFPSNSEHGNFDEQDSEEEVL